MVNDISDMTATLHRDGAKTGVSQIGGHNNGEHPLCVTTEVKTAVLPDSLDMQLVWGITSRGTLYTQGDTMYRSPVNNNTSSRPYELDKKSCVNNPGAEL